MSKTFLYHKGETEPYGETIIYDEAEIEPTKGKRICLIPGHDAKSKGAIGSEGISEWDFNDSLINDMWFMLPKKHTYYVLHRNADIKGYTNQMVDLHERIDKLEIDVSVEFHFNGSDNPNVNGHEVLYCSETGSKVATKLNDEFNKWLPNSNRGTKQIDSNDSGGGFCCRGKSVAIIAEPFFNSRQNLYAVNGEYRKALKLAYKNFFNSL